jgi:hypothetical protein
VGLKSSIVRTISQPLRLMPFDSRHIDSFHRAVAVPDAMPGDATISNNNTVGESDGHHGETQ